MPASHGDPWGRARATQRTSGGLRVRDEGLESLWAIPSKLENLYLAETNPLTLPILDAVRLLGESNGGHSAELLADLTFADAADYYVAHTYRDTTGDTLGTDQSLG